jgi:hypothetical protein
VETVWLVAGRDLRRRWRRVVALALLVGVAGAFTFALAAGARRTRTALDRFQTSSRAADLELDTAATPEQVAALRALPGVRAAGALKAIALFFPQAPDFQNVGAPSDTTFGSGVDRDLIVAGRAPNPEAVDEVTLGESLAARLGVRVGDAFEAASFTPKQIADNFAGRQPGPPAGPRVTLRVVGMIRRPLDLGDRGATGGLMLLTPAFARAHASDIGVFGSRIRVRTDQGAADVPRVLDGSRRILGDALFASQDLTLDAQGARHAIDVLALALWIGAAIVAVAGAVAIGVVMSREIALFSRDQRTLRDLGCTRRQLVGVSAPLTVLVALGGTIVAVAGATLASARFPVGLARRADPDVGTHADWPVLLLGAAALAAIIIIVALVTAWRTTAFRPERAAASTNTALLVGRVAATRVAPTIANGVRMAAEPGNGRAAVPVRSAALGAVFGLLGVTAVLVFAANVDRLVTTPHLYGATWNVEVRDITLNTPCGAAEAYGLERETALTDLSERCEENVTINGKVVPAAAFTRLRGEPIWPPVLAGRVPERANEVALGSKTLDALGKRIGDTVTVEGRNKAVDYTIVGRAVLPTLGDGALFTGAGYAPLFDPNIYERTFVGHLAPGASLDLFATRTQRPELATPIRPAVPVAVDRLRQVNWLPVTIAVFLGALALLGIAHALVTTVRRRRRDLAVLKTLGFSRRQLRATVAWQATALSAVGIVVGIPIGCLIGVVAWRLLAAGLGVAPNAAIPVLGVLATIPVTILLVNAIAFFPARAAARTRAAVALRTE